MVIYFEGIMLELRVFIYGQHLSSFEQVHVLPRCRGNLIVDPFQVKIGCLHGHALDDNAQSMPRIVVYMEHLILILTNFHSNFYFFLSKFKKKGKADNN